MLVCKRCFVSGRVQGVFYRASAQAEAKLLGVTGYAKNLEDGRVEVLVCGVPEKVDALIEWLWQGPRYAKVTNIEIEEINVSPPADFTTA